MIYSPKLWENNTLGPIFTEILYANDTLAKGWLRVLENIKYEQTVTTLTGDFIVKDYQVTPVADSLDVRLADRLIKPAKKQIFVEFEMESLRNSRFGADMKAGAANLESNEFLQAVIALAKQKIGAGIEVKAHQLLVDELVKSTEAIKVKGVVLTPANIAAEIAKVYAALPGAVVESGKATIFAPAGVLQLIAQANVSQTYRDTFVVDVTARTASYLGVNIHSAPGVPANTMYAGFAGSEGDFVVGTDLASDFGSLEVGKDKPSSDMMYMKSTFSLDTAVLIPSQKVIYSPAVTAAPAAPAGA